MIKKGAYFRLDNGYQTLLVFKIYIIKIHPNYQSVLSKIQGMQETSQRLKASINCFIYLHRDFNAISIQEMKTTPLIVKTSYQDQTC